MNWTIWKKIALPLILAVVALAFWLLAGRQSPSDLNRRAGVPQPVPVEVANVERGPMGLRCTFSGALESPAELLVAPKVGGRVERLAETETAYGCCGCLIPIPRTPLSSAATRSANRAPRWRR